MVPGSLSATLCLLLTLAAAADAEDCQAAFTKGFYGAADLTTKCRVLDDFERCINSEGNPVELINILSGA